MLTNPTSRGLLHAPSQGRRCQLKEKNKKKGGNVKQEKRGKRKCKVKSRQSG
jgi:hypothetical protein